MRITGGEGVDLIIDALGPTSFRKDYRLLRSGGRMVMYGLSRAPRTGARDLPATLQEPAEDAAGDDALVEEPDDDEREQRRLRPQHAQLVGPRGQPRPRHRAAAGRPRGGPRLEPVVAEAFPFERAGEAHEFIAQRRNVGKVVLFP